LDGIRTFGFVGGERIASGAVAVVADEGEQARWHVGERAGGQQGELVQQAGIVLVVVLAAQGR